MKLVVDSTKCEGNLECMLICPEVFTVNSDNQAEILVEEAAPPLQEKVKLAVQACPRAAIKIVE